MPPIRAWSSDEGVGLGLPVERPLWVARSATIAAPAATTVPATIANPIVSACSNAAPAGIASTKGTNANDAGSGSE